jgi:hypothetical protein
LRHTSPVSSSGLIDVAATEMAATEITAKVRATACFVVIAGLDGRSWWISLICIYGRW